MLWEVQILILLLIQDQVVLVIKRCAFILSINAMNAG